MHYVLLNLKNQRRKIHHRLYFPWSHYRTVNMTWSWKMTFWICPVYLVLLLAHWYTHGLVWRMCWGCSQRPNNHLCRQSWAHLSSNAVQMHWLRLQHRTEPLSAFLGPVCAADPSLAYWLKTLKLDGFTVCINKLLPHLQCRHDSNSTLLMTQRWTIGNKEEHGPRGLSSVQLSCSWCPAVVR